ncbi:hypothetical protein SAMN06265367_103609 [Algoriphagus winogradskyi]|uniref:Uncharacterized protein n=1 Tax=Algoriphagus winogradskyi TaxID=237017 RepID=A0ABY1P2R2_9BACT|nr:hypothetical protein SAMN06265367_103609 [Algoriphagus winogradskyi]
MYVILFNYELIQPIFRVVQNTSLSYLQKRMTKLIFDFEK